MTDVTIRILGLVSGATLTPFDGQWLLEYDRPAPASTPTGIR